MIRRVPFPSSGGRSTSGYVDYTVTFSPQGTLDHWRVVALIRSSGARFDVATNCWVVTLPIEVEPLLAPGGLGEALISGEITLERTRERRIDHRSRDGGRVDGPDLTEPAA